MQLIPTESLAHIDIHLAKMLQRLSGEEDPKLFLVAALLSSQTRAGHICLDLVQLDDPEFLTQKLGAQSGVSVFGNMSSAQIAEHLGRAPVVGEPGEFHPLILDKQRLYLKRYWDYQERLTAYIKRASSSPRPIGDTEHLRERLTAYFQNEGTAVDWQKVAAAMALLQRFCVISGGPGTGKTHTVAKIIALLLEQASPRVLRIKLAAPTGKAAVRLQESIRQVKAGLPCSEDIRACIPEQASTIHRLLGTIRNSPYFRHNADNPIEVDVLVVDEASMIDLALMAKLVDALPADARLILLGDNNQLSSVEAGSVLADICGHNPTCFSREFCHDLEGVTGLKIESDIPARAGLQDNVVQLRRSYRFDAHKGIGALSRAVNEGDAEAALAILQSDSEPGVRWRTLDMPQLHAAIAAVQPPSDFGLEINAQLDALSDSRVLCAVREGPQGVRALNRHQEQLVKRRLGVRPESRWFPGQPILITENDYHLNLFNGDLGFVTVDSAGSDRLQVFFTGEHNQARYFQPFRLPAHETAYAMTVHKSQGSEFRYVILVLPAKDNLVLTRELVYTAITRAYEQVEIWGEPDIFRAALQRQTHRSSGLKDALWS